MRKTVYLDTSALAKWYLNETRSEEVEAYIQRTAPVNISDLTVVEMRSLLARRCREGDIDRETEIKVYSTFEEDSRQGSLCRNSLPGGTAAAAVHLIATLPEVALRTLDAMHLAVALEIQAEEIASADRTMLSAAKALGLSVVQFCKPDRAA